MGICWPIPSARVLQPADVAWHSSMAGAKQILHEEGQVKMFLVPDRDVLGAAVFCRPLNRFLFLYIP